MNSLAAAGPTALFEAVQTAAFAARSSGLPRQAVVMLSDGQNEDANSTATAASSLAAARGARVPMFTVAFGADADLTYLRQLSTESGGASYVANQFDVAATYAGIGALLRSQYVLTLRATAPPDGQDATLRVAATIDGQTVTSDAARYVRGAVQVQPTIVPTAPAPTPATSTGDGGSSNSALAFIAIAVVVALLVVAVLSRIARAVLRARSQRDRDRHAGQLSDEEVPQRAAPTTSADTEPERTAELLLFDPDGETRRFLVGNAPLAIGSDERADIRLESDPGVSPRHATVWFGDGKLRLRHVGGVRPTIVDGRAIDVIILDAGDEFSIGRHRFRVGGDVPAPIA